MKNRALTKEYKSLTIAEVAMQIVIDRSDGNYLIDIEGNRYLDCTSGYGVVNSGWNRQKLVDVAKEQLDKLSYSPPWFPTSEAIDLAKTLHEITHNNYTKVVRATGGGEANEIIFKASYVLSKKPGVLSFERSYHGGSKFAINMSDHERFHFPAVPLSAKFYKLPVPTCNSTACKNCSVGCSCIDQLEKILQDQPDIGAFFLEPVIGSGGIYPLSEFYLREVRRLCSTYDIVMVLDEVITGFGRVGHMTSIDSYGVIPDAMAFAKGMGGGIIPIGAAMLNQKLAEALAAYEDVSASFAWTPIACAVANANISLILQENLPKNAAIRGVRLRSELTALFQRYIPEHFLEIRGKGLMLGISLVEDMQSKKPHLRLIQLISIGLVRNGLMICESWDFLTMILLPPLNITNEEIDELVSIFEKVLQERTRS